MNANNQCHATHPDSRVLSIHRSMGHETFQWVTNAFSSHLMAFMHGIPSPTATITFYNLAMYTHHLWDYSLFAFMTMISDNGDPTGKKSSSKMPTITPIYLILAFSCLTSLISASIFDQTTKSQCQPIDVPLCQDLPYNMTIHPNPIFPHDQQSDQTEHFRPLIKTKCNPHIKFFVCSVFAPMCPIQLPQAVTSCRSVCEEVKRDCIKILQEFDLEWPAALNCSHFPEGPELCMRPQEDPLSMRPINPQTPDLDVRSDLEAYAKSKSSYPACPIDLIDLDPTNRNGTCAFRCHKDTMFTKHSKVIANQWIVILSAAGIAICMFTVLTFMIDAHRFRFPERSIMYIALCYLLYALPYLAKSFLTYEQTACDRLRPSADRHFLVHGGLDNTVCVMSFLFTYYFSIAGVLWWLMLTFTWYLSASRKWVQEEIEKRSTYLHLFAWGIPCFLTIFVLITQKVDASELTGICSVGNSNPYVLLGVVIAPKAIFLLLGTLLVINGFSSMFSERQVFHSRGTDTSKLEKFLVKMGLFAFIYISTMIVVLAADGYHVFVLARWYPATIACKHSGGADRGRCRRPPQPEAVFYIVALAASLITGAATVITILSAKTFKAWQRFLCCGGCQAPPTNKYTTTLVPMTHAHLVHNGHNGSSILTGASSSGLPAGRAPPSRNPPPPPPPSANHYIPLSVMTSNAGGPSGTTMTYAAAGDPWKSSKMV
uniref:Frizzled-4 n=1 Tax=Panagrellus redivivus TaxID=6233 RepID=A0A7E4VRH7_PANRE